MYAHPTWTEINKLSPRSAIRTVLVFKPHKTVLPRIASLRSTGTKLGIKPRWLARLSNSLFFISCSFFRSTPSREGSLERPVLIQVLLARHKQTENITKKSKTVEADSQNASRGKLKKPGEVPPFLRHALSCARVFIQTQRRGGKVSQSKHVFSPVPPFLFFLWKSLLMAISTSFVFVYLFLARKVFEPPSPFAGKSWMCFLFGNGSW